MCFITEIVNILINLNLFTDWITKICNFWEENDDGQPSINLGCFVFELASLVSKNEERFLQLSSANVYLRLCDMFHVRKPSCAIGIQLAYVKLLDSFLEHK